MIIIYIYWYLLSQITLILFLKYTSFKTDTKMEKRDIQALLICSAFPLLREIGFGTMIFLAVSLAIIVILTPTFNKLTNWIYS